MLFSAKVVEDCGVGKLLLRIGAIGFAFILLTVLISSLQFISPFFGVALLVIMVAAAIIYKGDLSSYKMVNDLYVYVDGMQICRIQFPFTELRQLNFEFQSYQNDVDYRLAKTNEFQSFGMGNNVSFVYRNQVFKYQFYLQSRQHYVQFVQMLEQLYHHKITFVEKNLKGKTFLMRNVDDDQLRSLKSHYHYD